MKKKLLTVLLAVVMVFGVFSLTACGAKENPADDYNYYRSVYSSLKDEEDIRIHSMVFMQLTMMLRTPGQYLIYTGGAWDQKAQDNIKAVNDLAKKYDVQIYNLDLKLDGGISAGFTGADKEKYGQETVVTGTMEHGSLDVSKTATIDYSKAAYINDPVYDASPLTEGSGKVASIREALQQYLGTYKSHGLEVPAGSNLTEDDIPEAALISLNVTGAPSTTTSTVAQYRIWNDKATKKVELKEGKEEVTCTPGWINFTMTDAQMVELAIEDAANSLADFRADLSALNLKDADGTVITGDQDVYITDDATVSSTKYSVTVQEGKIGTDSVELEKVIQSIALTVPSFGSQLASGNDNNNGPYDASGFDASVIDEFDYFGDYRLHMAGDYDTRPTASLKAAAACTKLLLTLNLLIFSIT